MAAEECAYASQRKVGIPGGTGEVEASGSIV